MNFIFCRILNESVQIKNITSTKEVSRQFKFPISFTRYLRMMLMMINNKHFKNALIKHPNIVCLTHITTSSIRNKLDSLLKLTYVLLVFLQ